MDRNQAIGLSLMGLVMVVYFTFFAEAPQTPPVATDSTQKTAAIKGGMAKDTAAPAADTAQLQAALGTWAQLALGTPATTTLSNDKVAVTFTNKGGALLNAEVKGYKTWDGKPLVLFNEQSKKANLSLTEGGKAIDLNDIYFTPTLQGNTLTYTAAIAGKTVTQVYTLPTEGYELSWQLKTAGMNLSMAHLSWQQEALPFERDIKAQRITTTVNWYEAENGFDNLGEAKTDQETTQGTSAKWLAMKQKFFITALLTPNGTGKWGAVSGTNMADTAHIKRLAVEVDIPTTQITGAGAKMGWYLGPNKFKELTAITSVPDFDKNLYLGWPVINLINRWLTVNVFSFLESSIANYGIIILLLALMVRIILLPLGYKSFISMAKMKVLKPELDEIKARVGDDMQAMQAEQMKLYGQVGINPLSGCIPLLLQMPVLFAMFNFFPNSIELRQQALWWAQDLSTYDDLISWSASVPFLGHHLSIFNVLLMFSTLGITYFNNQNTAQVNAQMKYIGYIMPVVLMFVLNDLPAGLNFYYLVSNVLSMTQQVVIRRFVDENALHAQLQANKEKNKDKPKNSFAKRLEDAMKMAEEQRKLKDQNKKK